MAEPKKTVWGAPGQTEDPPRVDEKLVTGAMQNSYNDTTALGCLTQLPPGEFRLILGKRINYSDKIIQRLISILADNSKLAFNGVTVDLVSAQHADIGLLTGLKRSYSKAGEAVTWTLRRREMHLWERAGEVIDKIVADSDAQANLAGSDPDLRRASDALKEAIQAELARKHQTHAGKLQADASMEAKVQQLEARLTEVEQTSAAKDQEIARLRQQLEQATSHLPSTDPRRTTTR